jgi:hypothetical protein
MSYDIIYRINRFTIIIYYILSFYEGVGVGSFKNRGVGVGGFVYRLHSPGFTPLQGITYNKAVLSIRSFVRDMTLCEMNQYYENSSLLRCEAVSLTESFPTFRKSCSLRYYNPSRRLKVPAKRHRVISVKRKNFISTAARISNLASKYSFKVEK